jgi:hypothetical protein
MSIEQNEVLHEHSGHAQARMVGVKGAGTCKILSET